MPCCPPRETPMSRFVGLLTVLLLVSGCSAVAGLSSAGRPLDTFELTPLPARVAVVRGSRQLVVEPPAASGTLATDRIAVKPDPFQVSYLPGARWADAAPELVQLLLARSLEGTGRFALVSTGRGEAEPDWYLASDLQAFHVEVGAEGAAQVRVRLRATLISDADRRIAGGRTFEAVVPAAAVTERAVVPAFDLATTAVLRDLTDWVAATAR